LIESGVIPASSAVPHAWVSIMTPGDLSSFKWLEGNLDPDRFVLVFFTKYWTLICTFIRLVTNENYVKIFDYSFKLLYCTAAAYIYILCSQELTSPVPAESISHLKSYFSMVSFNKHDIYFEHSYPEFSKTHLSRKHPSFTPCDRK